MTDQEYEAWKRDVIADRDAVKDLRVYKARLPFDDEGCQYFAARNATEAKKKADGRNVEEVTDRDELTLLAVRALTGALSVVPLPGLLRRARSRRS